MKRMIFLAGATVGVLGSLALAGIWTVRASAEDRAAATWKDYAEIRVTYFTGKGKFIIRSESGRQEVMDWLAAVEKGADSEHAKTGACDRDGAIEFFKSSKDPKPAREVLLYSGCGHVEKKQVNEKQFAKLMAIAKVSAESPISMELLATSKVWKPSKDEKPTQGESLILRIINNDEKDHYFNLFDTVRPTLFDDEGHELRLDGGRDGTTLPMPAFVKAGQSAEVKYPITMNLPAVSIADLTGGVWVYHDLNPGKYTMRMRYENKDAGVGQRAEFLKKRDPRITAETPFWLGQATTNDMTITVADQADDNAGKNRPR